MVSVPSSPQVITAFVEWTRTLNTSKKKRRTYPVTVYNLPSFRVEYLWPFQVKFCLRLRNKQKKNTNHFHSGNSSQHGSCPFQTQPYHSSWREHICEEFRHLISSWESMKSTKKTVYTDFILKSFKSIIWALVVQVIAKRFLEIEKGFWWTILIGTDRNGMDRQKDLFLNDDDESR